MTLHQDSCVHCAIHIHNVVESNGGFSSTQLRFLLDRPESCSHAGEYWCLVNYLSIVAVERSSTKEFMAVQDGFPRSLKSEPIRVRDRDRDRDSQFLIALTLSPPSQRRVPQLEHSWAGTSITG